TRFTSARKIKHGHIIYRVNSTEAANWLRFPDGLDTFTLKFGTEVSLSTKLFLILVEYTPICFDISNPFSLREVEKAARLSQDIIKSARWIKFIDLLTFSNWIT
ncbi:hypothetical protein J3A83DRAFT_4084818, partial [Scleroderma citrinum]